jgi:hypothetical protein
MLFAVGRIMFTTGKRSFVWLNKQNPVIFDSYPMIMKKFIPILAVILVITCCKKKDKEEEQVQTTTTTGSTTGSTTGANPTPPVAADAILTVSDMTSSVGGFEVKGTSAQAAFYSAPKQAADPSGGVNAGKVKLNGDTLSWNGSSYTSMFVPKSGSDWIVEGSSNFPGFNVTSTTKAPSYASAITVPDAVSKSAGFSIQINGLTNVTSAMVLFSDGSSSLGGLVLVNLKLGDNKIDFTPSMLSGMTPGNQALLDVMFENADSHSISGKTIRTTSARLFIKQLTLNN